MLYCYPAVVSCLEDVLYLFLTQYKLVLELHGSFESWIFSAVCLLCHLTLRPISYPRNNMTFTLFLLLFDGAYLSYKLSYNTQIDQDITAIVTDYKLLHS